ncbi:MAG: hypothetical protein ACI3XX_01040 [Eubacteriales bacterium]
MIKTRLHKTRGGESTEKKEITIEDLIKKRKQRWKERHDMNFDAELTSAIADKIIDTPSLTKAILEKPYLLIECCFSLVDKKKRNVPFFLNEVQRDFIEKLEQNGRSKPYFILKGRQQGFTTVITAIQLAYAIVTKNFAGFTLADRDDNTKAIFIDKAKVMYGALTAGYKIKRYGKVPEYDPETEELCEVVSDGGEFFAVSFLVVPKRCEK